MVLVLYRVAPLDCRTLVSLCRSLRQTKLAAKLKLLIYDNSPAAASVGGSIPVEYTYVHNAENGGLAAAYKAATEIAEKDRFEWLLLLDQDTDVTPQYLAGADKALLELSADLRVGAIVPKLRAGEKLVSPTRVRWGGFFVPLGASYSGTAPSETTALNSGALLRASAIREIGGFDADFWLDYLDHRTFHQLYCAGFRIHVMDVVLQHSLSIINFGSVPEDRYRNILAAERAFYRKCKSAAEQRWYALRLAGRAAKFLLRGHDRGLFRATVTQISAVLTR